MSVGRICLIHLAPFHYIHILNLNTNVTRLEVGPKTVRCMEHEKVVNGPKKMVVVPPRHYCFVKNPVVRNDAGMPLNDKDGQAKLKHGDLEIRFESEDPWPLYPGEELKDGVPKGIQEFTVVKPNEALLLRAYRSFETEELTEKNEIRTSHREAGEEWLFYGPATYQPRVDVEIVETRKAVTILPNTALEIQAIRACLDSEGVPRKAGEKWMVRTVGAYMPGVDEEVQNVVQAIVLTPKRCLVLRARQSFVDRFERPHKKGEEWLVTHCDTESYIPDVCEVVVGINNLISLSTRQFCVIRDPVDPETGCNCFGMRKVIRGEANFFLQPGENQVGSVKEVYVLGCDEALEVRCMQDFIEEVGKAPNIVRMARKAGSRWLVRGPADYVPPAQVEVISLRKAIIGVEGLNFFVFLPSTLRTVIVMIVLVLLLFVVGRWRFARRLPTHPDL